MADMIYLELSKIFNNFQKILISNLITMILDMYYHHTEIRKGNYYRQCIELCTGFYSHVLSYLPSHYYLEERVNKCNNTVNNTELGGTGNIRDDRTNTKCLHRWFRN